MNINIGKKEIVNNYGFIVEIEGAFGGKLLNTPLCDAMIWILDPEAKLEHLDADSLRFVSQDLERFCRLLGKRLAVHVETCNDHVPPVVDSITLKKAGFRKLEHDLFWYFEE